MLEIFGQKNGGVGPLRFSAGVLTSTATSTQYWRKRRKDPRRAKPVESNSSPSQVAIQVTHFWLISRSVAEENFEKMFVSRHSDPCEAGLNIVRPATTK
jgi:hypothetical protein